MLSKATATTSMTSNTQQEFNSKTKIRIFKPNVQPHSQCCCMDVKPGKQLKWTRKSWTCPYIRAFVGY